MKKETYTEIFLKELGEEHDKHAVADCMRLWWQNTRNKDTGGLRLTERGLEIVFRLDLKLYDIPFPKDMPRNSEVLIFLDKFIDCPYFLGKTSVTLTGERKAIELTLLSGDVRKFGLNKAIARQRKLENS